MTNNLNFQWDNDEHLFLLKLAKNNNTSAMKNVEYYLDFLSDIEPCKETNISSKIPKIKFTL